MANEDSDSPKKTTKPKSSTSHPKFLDMAVEAVTNATDTKGASVPAIRNYITEKYKTVDPNALKFRLKQALTKATEKEIIVATKATADRPLMSCRFKLNKANLQILLGILDLPPYLFKYLHFTCIVLNNVILNTIYLW